MKLWILSSTLVFFLFLIFFARQFPKYNWIFTAWLLMNVGMQALFAVMLGLNLKDRIPDVPIDILGWALAGAALVLALRRQDAVNEIIASALIAQVLLHGLALGLLHVYGAGTPWGKGAACCAPTEAATLVSNVACFAPLAYMLVRFSTVYSDRLPLWVKQVSGAGCRVSEVFGFARSFLG